MAVSDETGGSEPIKPKRILRPLTDIQWKQARIMFETAGLEVTQADIAKAFDTSLSSVQKRSAAEKWSKGAQLVVDARKHLATATQDALAKAAETAGSEVATKLMKEIQPWIEKEKRHHIKRAIKRSKTAFKRLDRVAQGYQVYDAKRGELVECETTPKDEMAIANAEEKYDSIIRRTLGMNEGSGIGGSLSVQVLTNQSAVSIKTESV